MTGVASQIVVFVGPSLEREAVRRVLPRAQIEPPVGRGDIDRLRSIGCRRFVIIDGAFAHELAVAPSEIVAALRGGAQITGAASIGAIRAAECWPAGMEGIGGVYRLYRMRVIRDDDEVAVATEPDRDYAATSTALINLRWMVLEGMRRGLLARRDAAAVLSTAKQTHFSARHWQTAFRTAGVAPTGELRGICERTDVKRRDAIMALRHESTRPAQHVVALATTATTTSAARGDRYPGHDPLLGYSLGELRGALTRWLFGCGRYRRHLDAYLGGESCEALWKRLVASGELEPELMRWHALERGRELDRSAPGEPALGKARDDIAAVHGHAGWAELVAQIRAGYPPGAIPLSWIEDASASLAQARRNLRRAADPLSSRVGA